jgi:hypothetical protein
VEGRAANLYPHTSPCSPHPPPSPLPFFAVWGGFSHHFHAYTHINRPEGLMNWYE